MKRNRLQNIVATSSFTLPVAAVISTLLWLSSGCYDWMHLLGWLICAFNTYLWIEINNTNTLMRIRSLMTATWYILFMGMADFLHPMQTALFVSCCILLSYQQLFKSYQMANSVVPVFHAFLCIGLGSLCFPHLLFFVPFILWYTNVYLRSLSLRSFCAALIGVVLPYCFTAAFYLVTGDMGKFVAHFQILAEFNRIDLVNYAAWGGERIASLLLLGILALIGSIRYMMTCLNDKIKTRMLFYLILTQEFLLFIFILLYPQYFDILYGLLIANSAPILSHYFAFTTSRLSMIFFLLTLVACFCLILMNLFGLWPV